MIGAIIVGLIGGWLGGFLFGMLGLGMGGSFLGALIVGIIGAIIILYAMRAMAGRSARI